MYDLRLGYPGSPSYLNSSLDARAEGQSRTVYLLVVAADAAVRVIGRAAAAALRRTVTSYVTWRRRRRTAQELSRLDPRMLRDIGVLPGEIDEIAASLTATRSPAAEAEPAARREDVLMPSLPAHAFDCAHAKRAA